MGAQAYPWLKHSHMLLAATSVALFSLRLLLWELRGSKPGERWLRICPHIIDTALLASGIGLAWFWRLSPFVTHWFSLKLLLVLVYILLGFAAMRFTHSAAGRRLAGLAALATVTGVATLALTKPF
ncbi:MAG: SirB2 family protein [Parahaliea sp.]